MQVASTTSSPLKPSSSSGGSDIAKLQKQLRELTEELKGVVSSDMDAKAKQEKAKLLQAQIQMVQAQITAIQRAQQQEQQRAQAAKAEGAAANAAQQQKAPSAKNPPAGLGRNVDTYV